MLRCDKPFAYQHLRLSRVLLLASYLTLVKPFCLQIPCPPLMRNLPALNTLDLRLYGVILTHAASHVNIFSFLLHVNFNTLNKVSKLSLVRGLPSKEFHHEGQCSSCIKGKQHKMSYKSIDESKTTNCLNLLHMDLFGPVRIMTLAKKRYCVVVVDDFSRFTWTFFLHFKDEAAEIIKNHITQVERQFDLPVKKIRSDNGT